MGLEAPKIIRTRSVTALSCGFSYISYPSSILSLAWDTNAKKYQSIALSVSACSISVLFCSIKNIYFLKVNNSKNPNCNSKLKQIWFCARKPRASWRRSGATTEGSSRAAVSNRPAPTHAAYILSSSFSNSSSGVWYPSIFLGRLFITSAKNIMSSAE